MTPADRKPRSRVSGDIENRIRHYLRDEPEWTAAQIWDAIGRDKASLRTVERRYAAFHGSAGDDEAWTIADARDDPEGAALVIPHLRHGFVTRRDADWIIILRRACPTLGDSDAQLKLVRYLARMLRRAADIRDQSTGAFYLEITRALAYAPWEDNGRRLGQAVRLGRLANGTASLVGYDVAIPTDEEYVQAAEQLHEALASLSAISPETATGEQLGQAIAAVTKWQMTLKASVMGLGSEETSDGQ